MKDYTLVVMAAGMGSRFGGLKQITPIDSDENYIIDYSIYDAKRAGFKKVVFVIKEENLDVFQKTIGNRIKNKIEVEYAFQKLEDIPIKLDITGREKPWGTVQAILASKPYVTGSFVVINADDFYGYDAFKQAINFLDSCEIKYHYACITYPFFLTKSNEGEVKRGIVEIQEDEVIRIVECSIGNDFLAKPLNGDPSFSILPEAPVSVNFFAFQQDVYTILEKYWFDFFQQSKEIIVQSEALLPECLEQNLQTNKIRIYNRPSSSIWLGMTYLSDLQIVKNRIQNLKENQEYPDHLWEEEDGKTN